MENSKNYTNNDSFLFGVACQDSLLIEAKLHVTISEPFIERRGMESVCKKMCPTTYCGFADHIL